MCGLAQHIVVQQFDDLAPEAALLKVSIDIDDQLVIVIDNCLTRGLCEIFPRVAGRRDFGKFAQRLIGWNVEHVSPRV